MSEKPLPWVRQSNHYDAAYVWLRCFRSDRKRQPDIVEAFIAGAKWAKAKAALSEPVQGEQT